MSISVSDSSQIFTHFTGELNNWYQETAEKTANKVYKISLKFIIDPSSIAEDQANPEVLKTGTKPLWTKQASSHEVRLSVRGTDLVVDRTFNSFANVIPHIQTATNLQIHAKAYIPPGGAVWEVLDTLVAQKTWVYDVKKPTDIS